MMLEILNDKLDTAAPELVRLDRYWSGTQPAAFLAPQAREALGDRLGRLTVNFPKLAVTSLAERLQVAGFRTAHGRDDELWTAWQKNRLDDLAAQAHTDALVYGRSFALVWAGPRGPQVTIESPRQVAVAHDPATRQVTAALKRWVQDGRGQAMLYGPNEIVRYRSDAMVADPAAMPPTGWTQVDVIDNPLGVVPMVPIVNQGRLLDVDGVSEMEDILDLTDALAKLMADAMVTSEFFARPRRWVTGLEVVEDEDGQPVNPFSDELGRLWQSEDPGTKFGQFDAARLDGYSDLTAVVTQQIGALTGLPPHYLGLHGDQPPSADGIRSAESSLVSRCYQLQRTFGQAWEQVARLMLAVRDGADTADLDVEVVWASPETRTPAQQADAAAKLVSMGVPLTVALETVMGFTPSEIERVRSARRGDALDTAGVDLAELVP